MKIETVKCEIVVDVHNEKERGEKLWHALEENRIMAVCRMSKDSDYIEKIYIYPNNFDSKEFKYFCNTVYKIIDEIK